ncbi:hypothetical protein SO694_0048102, partial [Aureococcus anophagefferens]
MAAPWHEIVLILVVNLIISFAAGCATERTAYVAASIAIPLDFFVFARRFHGDNFTFASMPWLDMMLAIICVFTGAVAGAVLRYRDDALGAKLEKRAAGLGICLLAAAVLVASVTNAKAFGMIPPKCWLAAVFPCPVALALGYWPSRIAGLSPLDARTVATEVGEANIGVAYAILLLLYDDDDDRTRVFAGLIAYTVMNEIYIFSAAAWWRCGAPIEKPPPSPRRPSGALAAPEDAGDVEAPKGDASGLELVAMLGGGGDDGGDDAERDAAAAAERSRAASLEESVGGDSVGGGSIKSAGGDGDAEAQWAPGSPEARARGASDESSAGGGALDATSPLTGDGGDFASRAESTQETDSQLLTKFARTKEPQRLFFTYDARRESAVERGLFPPSDFTRVGAGLTWSSPAGGALGPYGDPAGARGAPVPQPLSAARQTTPVSRYRFPPSEGVPVHGDANGQAAASSPHRRPEKPERRGDPALAFDDFSGFEGLPADALGPDEAAPPPPQQQRPCTSWTFGAVPWFSKVLEEQCRMLARGELEVGGPRAR